MATIQRFEDLEVWILARKFANSIFLLSVSEKFAKESLKNRLKVHQGL